MGAKRSRLKPGQASVGTGGSDWQQKIDGVHGVPE